MEKLDVLVHPRRYPQNYVREVTEWIGADFDPLEFDVAEATERVRLAFLDLERALRKLTRRQGSRESKTDSLCGIS